jgi:hypothetical protein
MEFLEQVQAAMDITNAVQTMTGLQ